MLRGIRAGALPGGGVVTTLIERLWNKVDVREADACWPWLGCMSIGTGRCVPYGNIRQGARGTRLWRVNRLVLVLAHGETDVPPLEDESFDAWLDRCFAHYYGLEASHECDDSRCCNPRHLAWKSHTANVVEQAERRQAAREAVAA